MLDIRLARLEGVLKRDKTLKGSPLEPSVVPIDLKPSVDLSSPLQTVNSTATATIPVESVTKVMLGQGEAV